MKCTNCTRATLPEFAVIEGDVVICRRRSCIELHNKVKYGEDIEI